MTQNSNIRRIDELGRIVIPKDIRKKLHIKESEPLEIYVDDGIIKIKKYSSLPDIIDYIKKLIDIGNRITGQAYIVTNRDEVIASTNTTIESAKLDRALENLVLKCQDEKNVPIDFNFDEIKIAGYANIVPIIIDNDRSGIIVEYNETGEIKNQETIKIFKNLIENALNNY